MEQIAEDQVFRIEEFYTYLRTREKVRIAKEVKKLDPPWSTDRALNACRFTNVHREDDATTRFLCEHFYHTEKAKCDPALILLNAAIFRYFGTKEFAAEHGWAKADWTPEYTLEVARDMISRGEKVFTAAYVITNSGIAAPKHEVVVNYFLKPLWAEAEHIVKEAERRRSWKDMIDAMTKVPGFGGTGFMAKEVALDTILTPMWKRLPEDYDQWCPVGPGAAQGLNAIYGRPYKASMNKTTKQAALKEVFSYAETLYTNEMLALDSRPLHLHDIQFGLCEYAKWHKFTYYNIRPKRLYHAGPRS